jgi:hypothetical protein
MKLGFDFYQRVIGPFHETVTKAKSSAFLAYGRMPQKLVLIAFPTSCLSACATLNAGNFVGTSVDGAQLGAPY